MTDIHGQTVAGTDPQLSIIVPVFNEEHGIDPFLARLESVLKALGGVHEIIFVDDGSTDQTVPRLIHHRIRNPQISVVVLSRNFGKEVAVSAGLDHARGRAVVPIDVDLQDPPELIIQMHRKWCEGYDVVYARRSSRNGDYLPKRITARLFYRLHNLIADVTIPHDTGDYRLLDRRVVEALKALPERTRFMKGLFAWVGFRQIGVDYPRMTRAHGVSKWRYRKLWNFALDGITASSTIPLRMWTYIGAAVALPAVFYALWLAHRTVMIGVDVPGYASLMVAVLLLGAVNIIATGILGEYVGRIYIEARHRPLYLVREIHGVDQREHPSTKWTETYTKDSIALKHTTGGSRRVG
jgi:glycosyltransferase involved in cell wall biosynthesis